MKRRFFTWTVVLILGFITGILMSCGGGSQHCEAYSKANYKKVKQDRFELKIESKKHKGKTEIPYRNK